MKSRSFARFFLETSFAGTGGALGSTGELLDPDAPVSSDNYAPNDTRIPKVLGKIQRRNIKNKKSLRKWKKR